MWFMSNLKEFIGDSAELVFVSDRKNSIFNAIANIFFLSQHRYCIWHLEKNLIQRYNNASAIFLFKRVAKTSRVEKFERLMGQIHRVSERAYGYLERAGSLPITCLVEHIRQTMQKWFYERRTNATACSALLSSRMESELRTTFEAGATLRAQGLTENLTQVRLSNDTDIVDFSDNTCICREFQLNHMPCIHASRAACLRGKSLYDLCSPYYTSDYWRGAYSEAIYPLTREVDWIVPNEISGTPILPPSVHRPLGRPPTRHHRSRQESTTRLRKCTHCGRVGHNRTTCSNPIVPRPIQIGSSL
ncbi:uncharacterized protein LOC111380992 [Olea europaea var. sylvestris]|uniref:uncharacterized protein LOC111380992 n=1 Tax=Olea europaea var. sylvestris TaxID=158386 RepID=UPI000C1D51BF|nr:uncharacterized protein LOC111380992 [Olea europaea var. sylvestris]